MADTQLAETLFTAMDEIIHKRIEDLPYDKTILATIESNKNAETLGEYIVNDGSTTMRAYSDNHNYKEGDKVYVSIPQGNYNEQKNIVGLYITDSNGQVLMNYNDPLSDLVDITGNIYDNEQDVYALTANDRSRPDTGRIWHWSAKDYDENPFMEFGVLGLSASFKTTIGRFDSIASGQYGIRLNIVAIRNAQQTLTDNKIYYTFKLDSNDFFGDPYNFETYYKQAKMIHLREKDVSRIDEMEIIFYQKNNFFNVNGDYVSSDINENALTEDGLIGNLFVKDIELKFGYDIQEFQNKNDTVILYSADPRTYINKITDNVKIKYPTEEFDTMEFFQKENFLNLFNKKKIVCRWIHKNEDGVLEYYGGNGEELPEQACIKWYRYHYTDQDNSFKYSNPPGDYWELIPCDDDFTVTITPDIYNVSEKIKAVVWNPSQEYITEKKENNNQYIDASEYSEASFVMVLSMNPLHYLSLIFTDERYKAYFRKQCFRAPALKQLLNERYTDLKELEPKNSDDFNNEELIKKYNDAFDLIYASDNTEDTFFISQFIQQACYDMNLHLQFYNIFQYIRITNGNDYETEQDKLNAELALLENFYTTNYKELIELDVISYPGRFFSANDKSRIQELLEEFISDKQNCELYSISLSSQLEDYSLDNTLNTLFMGEGSPYQAVEQPADTRDYKQIKTLFTELPDKVDKAIKEYSETILKKGIKEQWKNAAVNSSDFVSELLYRQCIYYNNFNNLYEDKYKDQTQIGNMINGEAAYIISNEIEFTNEDPDAWRDFDSIKSLKLTVDPEQGGTNGVFRFYNDDGSIVNDGDAQKVRKIVANYTNAYSGRAEIDVAEEVEWWIPRNYTMILPPEEGQDYNLYDLKNINSVDFANGTYYTKDINGYHVASTYSTEQSYYIKNDVEFFDEYDPVKLKELRYMDILSNYYIVRKKMPLKDYTTYGEEEATKCEMGFRVRNYYMPDAKNNTIHCVVTRNNKKVEADATLTFGIKGIMGTDYTLVLETETDRAVIPVGGEPFKVVAKLYDYMGNDITNSVNTYNFSWYSSGNGGLATNFQTTEDEPNKITITPDKNKPIEDYAHYVLEVVVPADDVLVGGNHMQVDFHALLPMVVVKDNFNYSYMDNVEIQTIEEIGDLPKLQELPEVLKNDQQIIDYYKSIINYVTRMTSEYDEKITSNQTELEEKIRQINALSILTEEERTNRINAETEKYNKVINQYQELKNSLNSQGISNIKKILVNQVSIVRYDGKSNISYDNTGCNPVNYKNEFKLYFRNKANAIQQVAPNSRNTVVWGTMYSFPTTVNEAIAKGELTAGEVARWNSQTRAEYEAQYQNNIKYFPKMENGKIVPQPLYMIPDASKSEISSAKCTVNGQIVFIMPLVMTQRVYNSKLLNNWSGELTIDQNNGTILSAMVGAGIKNNKNQFQGILMGNVADAADQNADIGIYGYHEGVQSFGFSIDGTAFLGKMGQGQIQFNGNSGTIQSASFDQGDPGTKIDLDDGNIQIRGKSLAKIILNAQPGNNKPYFKITDTRGHDLICIGNTAYNKDNFFIKSDNYNGWIDPSQTNGAGSFFNLATGEFYTVNGAFKGTIKGSTISGSKIICGNAVIDENGTITGTTITGKSSITGATITGGSINNELYTQIYNLNYWTEWDGSTYIDLSEHYLTLENHKIKTSITEGRISFYTDETERCSIIPTTSGLIISPSSAFIVRGGGVVVQVDYLPEVLVNTVIDNGILVKGNIITTQSLLCTSTIYCYANGSIANVIAASNDVEVGPVSILAANFDVAGIWVLHQGSQEGKWLCYIDKDGKRHHPSDSDVRVKNIYGLMPEEEAINILENIDIINFSYKYSRQQTIDNGIKAQQLRDVLLKYNIGYRGYFNIFDLNSKQDSTTYFDLEMPEDKVSYGLDYGKFTPLLWKGWQIHNNIIKQLQQEIKELKEKINENHKL